MQKKFGFSIESETTQQPTSLKVLLIGESCIDEYHYGECRRLSPEAPVPVLDYTKTTLHPGMASNVLQNLESFGCQVDFITNDPEDLRKTRFVDARSKQQLLRVDEGTCVDPLNLQKLKCLDDYDVIIFSDYDKGLIPWSAANYICEHYNGKIFVDSKKKDLSCYHNAYIKINEFEEKDALAYPESCSFIVTLGKDGAKWLGRTYPAPKVDVYDVSGAGDVFLATLAVTATTGDLDYAVQKSVLMASRSVQHFGTYKLTKEDIAEVL
jgi:D-beta-D-heptose 7-phosphate kinase/D-beta-D-heptose 1-phosphate adenosyltransferase